MKKFTLFLFSMMLTGFVMAQGASPVTWSFTSKKVSDKVYDIQMTATIDQGWHVYSQQQPDDAVAQPTSFSFNKNPLITLDGKVKEVGKLEKHKDELSSSFQYSNKVVFVQRVKVKSSVKTNLTGTLEFQTCNDRQCLPPKTVQLSVAL